MALYFFDLEQRGVMYRDDFGVELDGEAEVPDQAMALLAEAIRDGLDGAPALLHGRVGFAVSVRDEAGCAVYRVHAAVEGESARPRARLCGPGGGRA